MFHKIAGENEALSQKVEALSTIDAQVCRAHSSLAVTEICILTITNR